MADKLEIIDTTKLFNKHPDEIKNSLQQVILGLNNLSNILEDLGLNGQTFTLLTVANQLITLHDVIKKSDIDDISDDKYNNILNKILELQLN